MKFFDYISFGLKNIGRQKARTILTIIAIVIGATSVVLMLTIIFGAKQAAVDQIQSAGGLNQITVSGKTDISSEDVFNPNNGGSSDGVKLTDTILAQVKAIPHVTTAYAELSVWQFSNNSATDAAGNKVKMDRSQTIAVVPGDNTSQKVVAGRNLVSTDTYQMVIGQQTLENMGLKGKAQEAIGKTLNFSVQGYVGDDTNVPKPPTGPQSSNNQYNPQQHIGTVTVTVIGVMSTGLYDQVNFVPMSLGRKMLIQNMWQGAQSPANQDCGRNGCQPTFTLVQNDQFTQQGYSAIVAKADDIANVDSVAAAVKKMGLGAATGKALIDQILQIFKMISIVFGAIGGISLLVAAIGVVNTMVMATLERTREIGVMRACGATKAAVRRLFTFEAALLGFWGGLIGVGVGYGLFWAVQHFAGSQLAASNVPLSVLVIPAWLALVTLAGTTVIGIMAGYWPAVRAARMNPVEALRYE